MRLAISNIAWDTTEDAAIARMLQRYGINAIDVAPGKYFQEPAKTTDKDIARIRRWWAERGIEIIGMQSLLFGTVGMNVFGLVESQAAMLEHFGAICRIGAHLGATRLVFGSPKNRDRTGLTNQEVIDVAIPFFRRMGDIAKSNGVVMCLEPNPPCYGANFMTTSAEAASVVELVSHPAIMMQLDTGALSINGEDAEEVLKRWSVLIGHIHASEPDLLPLGDSDTDHAKAHEALLKHLPGHTVSVEMLATTNEPHEVSIERALNVAIRNYRTEKQGTNA